MASRSLGRMARLTNMQVSVDKSGTTATVSIPGFSFSDFDRTGHVSAPKLQSLLTACRVFAYHAPHPVTGASFLEYDKLTADKFTFIASTRTTISRDFYALVDADRPPKLSVAVRLGYVGNSSLNSVAELTDANTGQVLANNTNQVVSVCKKIRKPTPLDDWWKAKYAASASGERLIIPLLQVPNDTHVLKMKVPWADIDAYHHTNYVAYIKYCLEAAMDAAVAGAYTAIVGDALTYHVRLMESAFKGETKAGDALSIRTWESPSDPRTLHFDISSDSKTVFQSSLSFY